MGSAPCGSPFTTVQCPPVDIVLFGIQGSGKGTQAKRLCEEFDFDLFEAGGELRAIAAQNSKLGREVKSYIDDGKLVPHEIIMKVVKQAIVSRPAGRSILFDGIPRDENQRRDFDAIMQELSREFRCIQILLPREKAMERILMRAEQEGRADDADMSIIERRMDTFAEKTLPVIRGYEQEGRLVKIDGDADIDAVYASLKRVVAAQ